MTDEMTGMRILVADDQIDVARTLCGPLRKAGAQLRFVPDGQAALAEAAARPFDLIIVDMKMPPEEWGGLWLLRQLILGGWKIPTLVLSGEGSKQQVIEALRLGSTDWIDKDAAGEELLGRCARIMRDSLEQSLQLASALLPSPLASRFARYARTIDPDKQVSEGLHTLEAVLRFAAALGLSNPTPAPLRGVTRERLGQPSMGTWFTLCTDLSKTPNGCSAFMEILSWIIPERADRQQVQDLIELRNDIAHGRVTATLAHRDSLDLILRRFAHRAASCWRSSLAVPTSMTYDGSTYPHSAIAFTGIGKPTPEIVSLERPQVTGEVMLFSEQSAPVKLFPWFVAQKEEHSGVLRIFQFDGLQRAKGGSDSLLRYCKVDDGEDMKPADHPGATWQSLAPWFR
ncbi:MULTISPECIES: response regulator transcription factor [unclassified Streptomyces]|uniref:response regulator transcription factor n=1 Tax=unclassified Streptomyces TaxID=2593676 RepID=UPI00099BCB05|nr:MULTISPECIES: response regulator [unclassified Streptomyces]